MCIYDYSFRPLSEYFSLNVCLVGVPLIIGVSLKSVNAINVWDVKKWIIAGRVRGHFYQDLIQKHWLE